MLWFPLILWHGLTSVTQRFLTITRLITFCIYNIYIKFTFTCLIHLLIGTEIYIPNMHITEIYIPNNKYKIRIKINTNMD